MLAVTGHIRRYRAHRTRTTTRRDALRALAANDPYLRLGVAEARIFASLSRWVTRRPDVSAGAVPIGYARDNVGMPIALAVAATIELVAVHLLVPWPVVRLVLDLLGVYGLLMVLGWLAGRIVRPHFVDKGAVGRTSARAYRSPRRRTCGGSGGSPPPTPRSPATTAVPRSCCPGRTPP